MRALYDTQKKGRFNVCVSFREHPEITLILPHTPEVSIIDHQHRFCSSKCPPYVNFMKFCTCISANYTQCYFVHTINDRVETKSAYMYMWVYAMQDRVCVRNVMALGVGACVYTTAGGQIKSNGRLVQAKRPRGGREW